MTIALRISTWILLLLTLAADDSAALQARRSDARAAAEALARVRPETRIRIETMNGRRITGRLDSASASAVGISHDGTVESIDLNGLAVVWTRGRHTKAGAIIGGVVGLGLGLATAGAVESMCEAECSGEARRAVITLLPVGALVGSVVGAVIPKWRRVLP